MNPFEDMRLFSQVLDAGSFTAAAEHLGVSKQLISRRVMALEARLGVRLLNRSTRRLDVTPLGQAYYDAAQRLLAEVEQVEQSIAGEQGEPRGVVRVSAPLSFAVEHLSALLPAFLQRYPGVTLELDLSDRNVDLLGEGFDLALRIGELSDSSLIVRHIAEVDRLWCASPGYLAAHGEPQTPEALAGHQCLPYGHGRNETWRFERAGKAQAIQVSGRLRANNGEVLRDAAIAGLGIAYLPAFIVAKALAQGQLCRLLDEFRPPPLPLSALYPGHRQASQPVRALVEFLREQLGH
ncbi:LysR substrate-binding domain-containing protein [Pseudomonas sp. NPDC007930]|uniref:LysR family transcriptional regulator n=1 Tax=Pseudomonas sp. NPDC007930 TaxID=3364417 RepID=UPI0036E939CA